MAKNNSAIIIIVVVLVAFCLLGSCVVGGGFVVWRLMAPWPEAAAKQFNEELVHVQIQRLQMAVETFELQETRRPQVLDELLEKRKFGGPILQNVNDLIDPWGNQYSYDPAGPRNNGRRPDIWTKDPKGRTIGNWK